MTITRAINIVNTSATSIITATSTTVTITSYYFY